MREILITFLKEHMDRIFWMSVVIAIGVGFIMMGMTDLGLGLINITAGIAINKARTPSNAPSKKKVEVVEIEPKVI